MPLDAEEEKDAHVFLRALVCEVREAAGRRARTDLMHYSRWPQLTEEEVHARAEEAIEQELSECAKKLAKLLMQGIS